LSVDGGLRAYRISIWAVWTRFGELARERGVDVTSEPGTSQGIRRVAPTPTPLERRRSRRRGGLSLRIWRSRFPLLHRAEVEADPSLGAVSVPDANRRPVNGRAGFLSSSRAATTPEQPRGTLGTNPHRWS
jgi:hypothetical protein